MTTQDQVPNESSPAVRADDALLDMLGSPDCMPGDVDGELARVLAAWRLEVHTDSARELVHTDTAMAVISAARRPARRWYRFWRS